MLFSADGAFFHIFRTTSPRIYTAPFDLTAGRLTSTPSAVRTSYPMNAQPAWSPDGESLAYLSSSSLDGSVVLSVQHLDSGVARDNLLPVQNVGNLRWSPDGKSIVTSGVDLTSQSGVFVVDAQTLQIRETIRSPDGTRFVYPQWSADGSSLFYLAATADRTSLVSRNIATGLEQTILTRTVPPAAFGTVSPNGQWLAVSNNDGSAINVISTGPDDERELLRAPARSFLGGPAAEWTPDGQSLLIRRDQGGSGWGLWLVSTSDGSARQIDLGVPNPAGFVRLSNQGKLTFMAGVERRELRMVQGIPLPNRTN